jgi:hypothetical protein
MNINMRVNNGESIDKQHRIIGPAFDSQMISQELMVSLPAEKTKVQIQLIAILDFSRHRLMKEIHSHVLIHIHYSGRKELSNR